MYYSFDSLLKRYRSHEKREDAQARVDTLNHNCGNPVTRYNVIADGSAQAVAVDFATAESNPTTN